MDHAWNLTPEQLTKAQKWLDGKVAGGVIGKCSLCGARNWTIQRSFVHTPVWTPEGQVQFTTQTTFPWIMVTCKTCSNTHLLSAVIMGVVPKDRPAWPSG